MKIKVKFVDNPLGFKPEKSVYMRVLKKRYDVELSDNPQIVFYGPFGTEFLHYPNSLKIFLATEPVIPNFNDCDYAIGPICMQMGTRYFRHPPIVGYGEEELYQLVQRRRQICEEDAERKFCNFIYTNAVNGAGAKKRIEFCQTLSKYRHIDCPGRVLNNMEGLEQRYARQRGDALLNFNDQWADAKLAFMQEYKFTISFENTALPGWTTEKLIHPLLVGSVPIYWGNPDVTEYFNPKAMICLGEDQSFEDLVHEIKKLDCDKARYLDMLHQPVLAENYPVNWEEDLAEFFYYIVESGMKPIEKNPLGFRALSAQDLTMLSRAGKIGLSSILRTAASSIMGWIEYKTHKK